MVYGMVQCFDFNLGKFLKIGFKVCLIARFSNDGDNFWILGEDSRANRNEIETYEVLGKECISDCYCCW